MRKLIFTVESTDESDLDFVRERMNGALLEVIDDYEQNLDGDVTVDWNWKD